MIKQLRVRVPTAVVFPQLFLGRVRAAYARAVLCFVGAHGALGAQGVCWSMLECVGVWWSVVVDGIGSAAEAASSRTAHHGWGVRNSLRILKHKIHIYQEIICTCCILEMC